MANQMTIEDKSSAMLGALCGAMGGLLKFSLVLMTTTFVWALLQAGITAFVCGLLGVAGKNFYDYAKNWIIKKTSKRGIERQDKIADTKVVQKDH